MRYMIVYTCFKLFHYIKVIFNYRFIPVLYWTYSADETLISSRAGLPDSWFAASDSRRGQRTWGQECSIDDFTRFYIRFWRRDIQVEPGQAGWRKFREREEPNKDKGELIGTAPDPLAGTAVDCVISWESFSLTFLALDMMSSLYLETEVVSAAFRFLLASLSLGVSFSGHLLLLTFSSLHISFSWRGFRLAPFFLFPIVSQFYFETSFC